MPVHKKNPKGILYNKYHYHISQLKKDGLIKTIKPNLDIEKQSGPKPELNGN